MGMSGLGLAILGMLLIMGCRWRVEGGDCQGIILPKDSPTAFVACQLISSKIAEWTKKTAVAAGFFFFFNLLSCWDIIGAFSLCCSLLTSLKPFAQRSTKICASRYNSCLLLERLSCQFFIHMVALP